MSRTLATAETVPVWQGFYRLPSKLDSDDDDYGELRVLVVLGSGMDGHLHTAHGGVAATLLDEAMGTIGGIYIGATLEDGNGTVFTAAEALFLEVERKPRPKI